MSRPIHPSIRFRKSNLPVSVGYDGVERVVFKTLCEEIGVSWHAQKRKIKSSEYLMEQLDVILGTPNTPQCRRTKRVRQVYLININTAYVFFNTLNPKQLLAQGNKQAANWLLRHRYEWGFALQKFRQVTQKIPTHHRAHKQPVLDLTT